MGQSRQSRNRQRKAKKERDRAAKRRELLKNSGVRGRMCTSKTRYPSKDSAVAAAARFLHPDGELLRAYKCSFCNGWHLTSKPLLEKSGAEGATDKSTNEQLGKSTHAEDSALAEKSKHTRKPFEYVLTSRSIDLRSFDNPESFADEAEPIFLEFGFLNPWIDAYEFWESHMKTTE